MIIICVFPNAENQLDVQFRSHTFPFGVQWNPYTSERWRREFPEGNLQSRTRLGSIWVSYVLIKLLFLNRFLTDSSQRRKSKFVTVLLRGWVDVWPDGRVVILYLSIFVIFRYDKKQHVLLPKKCFKVAQALLLKFISILNLKFSLRAITPVRKSWQKRHLSRSET